MSFPILAHSSGFSWDEALLVLAPLVVLGAFLVLLNRRAGRMQDETTGDDAVNGSPEEQQPRS